MVVDGLLATEEDGMTKKDYEVVARVFARHRSQTLEMSAGVERTCVLAALDGLAESMSRELLTASKFNNNGNKSFKPDAFLAACGVEA